jgi:Ser/Thr protein kinase RdoA (MazF antagonist)
LLSHLEATGFAHAPRFLGVDEQGRESLSFIEGWVPADLGFFSQHQYEAAARIIAAFHDATSGTPLAGAAEVVCHGDLSPCNFVFRGDLPVAIIDFDNCFPGPRMLDVGYAAWLWLDIGSPDQVPLLTGRRLAKFFRAYGQLATANALPAVLAAQTWLHERCHASARHGPQTREVGRWALRCQAWVLENRLVLERGLLHGEGAA